MIQRLSPGGGPGSHRASVSCGCADSARIGIRNQEGIVPAAWPSRSGIRWRAPWSR